MVMDVPPQPTGLYKLTFTEAGQLPTSKDLLKKIKNTTKPLCSLLLTVVAV
jgi:hypothetical protein